jgi:putative lipoic acid-binding regulatory protein
MIDLNNHKLELNYPCNWCYKIVIKHEHNGNKIAKEILGKREHKVVKSKISSGGKFKSYSIDLLVSNDDDRKELYKLFSEHKNIKMVV